MATKYECDRCKKIETDKEVETDHTGWGNMCHSELDPDDDGDPDSWDLCPACYRSLKKWEQRKS